MKSRNEKAAKMPARKPYHAPRLVIYGDLRTITQMIGSMAAPDGGPMMLMIKS